MRSFSLAYGPAIYFKLEIAVMIIDYKEDYGCLI